MKREFLKNLGITDEEVINKILDENSNDIGKVKIDTNKFEELKKELENVKAESAKKDDQIKEIAKLTKDTEDLNAKIKELQDENKLSSEAHAKELKDLKVNNTVEIMLNNYKAKNHKAVIALLKDLDKAEFNEDGSIKGLKEQFDNLVAAEDSKFLFDNPTIQLKGATPAAGSDGANPALGGKNPKDMTYSEMQEYLKMNPGATLE